MMNKYEALDIETIWDDEIAKPLCIAITANEGVKFKRISIDEIEQCGILNFMLENCRGKKIYYVHNLTFEIFVFINYFLKKGVDFKIVSANKVVYSAEIKWDNKKIRLRCSYRLTMLNLKTLAKLAGMEEKGIFPYKILDKNLKNIMKMTPDLFKNIEDYKEFIKAEGALINVYRVLEKYCTNDAIITKKSIIKYWQIIEEGGLKNNNRMLTAARLSIENYFRINSVIKKKIDIKFDRIIRTAYYGGRTEVFGNPEKNEILLHYDWSGMYAQCMSEKVLGGELYESDIILNLENPGFYWIKFIQDLEFPILPIRRGKLIFANGQFEGWYWFEEIILAVKYGVKIIEVKRVITAQYYDFFIRDFVELNNNIRKLSPLHKQIGKNNNNTFYGRLGINPDRLEEEIINKVEKNNQYVKIVKINNVYLGYKEKKEGVANVSISAAITAKARIKLYEGMMEVIKDGGRILYTDTDSIIAAYDKLEYKDKLDKKIGEVFFDSNKKDTIIIDGVFAMPKTYALKFDKSKVVKIKGFNVTPTFEKFKKTFYEKGSIKSENTEWSKKDFIIKYLIREKTTSLAGLDKRIWSHDLKRTKPLNL